MRSIANPFHAEKRRESGVFPGFSWRVCAAAERQHQVALDVKRVLRDIVLVFLRMYAELARRCEDG